MVVFIGLGVALSNKRMKLSKHAHFLLIGWRQ